MKKRDLKCPYYGLLKIAFHAVCNTALSEWKHPANVLISKCTAYKVNVSQKKQSSLNHWNLSFFFKRIPSRFMLTSTLNISILLTRLGKIYLCVGLNENANSSFPIGCRFGALNIAFSLVTAVHQMITNHRRLASHKAGVWKNESLSELFGSRWANKVNINAYYKNI